MSRKSKRLLIYCLSVGLVGILSVSTSPAYAQPTPDDLKRIEQQLQQVRQTQMESKRHSVKLANEIKAVQKQMVSSARAVREKEDMLDKLQTRLKELKAEEKVLSDRLSLTEIQTVKLVTALQTLALRPPEVMLLQPQEPSNALRSRLVLNNALPTVRELNRSVVSDLAKLTQTKSKIQDQAQRVKDTMAQLGRKKNQMNTLIRQKTKLQAEYDASHEEAQKRIVALAGQAKDVKDLLDRLAAEKKRRQQLAAARKEAPRKEGGASNALLPLGLSKTSFERAKGRLSFPVSGKIIERFGAMTAADMHAKGLTLSARSGGSVMSPFRGTVLFSGPFKSYGELLIIDNGGGYLMLLAGMESINVEAGQEILAGEPIGQMQMNRPKLYIEIRKDGQPINPEPWFATS